MNKSIIRALALFGLIATLGPHAAMAQGIQHFTIPFGFNAGARSFAAGTYRVEELSPHILRIEGDHSSYNVVVIPNGDEPWKGPGQARMSFQRYGQDYFLSRLSNQTHGCRVPPSVLERELIARQVPSKAVDLVALSRRETPEDKTRK
ncbi:MAG TPA: hypothetical protein VKG25_16760 [Bryobacteraceae bacterium]|nr:hypothetical protein [Bryobacteraceae bacterium]